MTIVAETFDCTGLSPAQLDIIRRADEACDFPWPLLRPGLRATTGGRDTIPVAFRDLTTWSARMEGSASHHHDHGHSHSAAGPEDAHLLEHRARALGLAYYSGKIELEVTLSPALAIEVFLAEAAHMIDFFYMTPRQRESIFDVFHGADDDPHGPDTDAHGHGWFEETGNNDYWSWVGEAFMGGFIAAFAPGIANTLSGFTHVLDASQAQAVRRVLIGGDAPAPDVEVDITGPGYFASKRGRTFHDEHRGIWPDRSFPTKEAAVADGLRPCGVCKPS